ncbi:MAG: LCP family protein [Anaerolineae bacterium]|nr:LCP family protein [Anaerolineae bacterium]
MQPTPWYLRLDTWVAIVIGAAIFGTLLIVALTLALAAEQPDAEGGVAVAPSAGSIVWATPVGGGNQQAAFSMPVVDPWNGSERYTVLVMGIDRRRGEPGSAFRTDTMLLVSIDPATQSLGILSIPRDLYVVIPGYSDRHRVNEALPLGELQHVDYGPQLAMQTVQLNFGIRVHEYITVEFDAFTTLIDAVGGIDVNVDAAINDPYYPDEGYGYDPFYIDAGLQHMDGATALRYARTRYASQ